MRRSDVQAVETLFAFDPRARIVRAPAGMSEVAENIAWRNAREWFR